MTALTFYNYISLPLAPQNLAAMLDYVRSRLHLSLGRVIIGLKYDRAAKKNLCPKFENVPNCRTEFFGRSTFEIELNNFIWKQIESNAHAGIVVLISDGGEEMNKLMKRIYQRGWRCVVVHSPLRMKTDFLIHAACTITLPIVKEKETVTSLRLYERRCFRRDDSSRKKKKQITEIFRWTANNVNRDDVHEALQENFSEESYPSSMSSDGLDFYETSQKMPIREISLAMPKTEYNQKLEKAEKVLVRWKKDTVNHDKFAHCMQNAQLCPKWDNKIHVVLEMNCNMWHPYEFCGYYPRCRWTAEFCGFAHPFCADGPCRCPPGLKDPQKNHYNPEHSESV